MSRRIFLHSVAATLLLPFAWPLAFNEAAGQTITPKKLNLQQTLEKGLYARRKEEFAFITKVVTLVEQKKIPLSMVNSTFLWARRFRRYPMVYFEFGMRARAKKIGVAV